ncbi:hypothetical protein [Actinoplanes sp. NPDC026670]|uniref:hypothetical protein n=1 Tax=Actinoplanes sp. NPDC026670 TaxID=3154700 RepID=UPI0033FC2FDC
MRIMTGDGMTIVSMRAGAAALAACALTLAGCTPAADPQPAPAPNEVVDLRDLTA